jgi:hypothetical protein
MHETSRLDLQVPDASTDDANTWPSQVAASFATLDEAVLTGQGTLSGRPNIGSVPNGYLWTCTDAPVAFVSVNSSWLAIPLNGGSVPVGTMIDHAAGTIPADADGVQRWRICDGSAISRTTYSTLFASIGTTWGAGDGSSTFNLPDLRGRTTVGVGQGPSLTNRALAAAGGEESHPLTVAELASHGHSVYDPTHAHSIADPGHAHGVYDPGHAHNFGYNFPANPGGAGWAGVYVNQGSQYIVPTNNNFGLNVSGTQASGTGIGIYAAGTGIGIYGAYTGISIYANGSGAGHNTMPPFRAVSKAIRIL